LNGLERALQFFKGSPFKPDCLIIFEQLPIQIVHIVNALFFDQLFHLSEDRLVLLIEGALIQAEVLMVQVKALVLLVDLGGQSLAQRLDFLVQIQHLFALRFRHLDLISFIAIWCLEGLSWLLETSEE